MLRSKILSRNYSLVTVLIQDFNKGPKIEVDDFDNHDYFKLFSKELPEVISKIEFSDIIVINGEGSIHGIRKISLTLLYLAYVSKIKFNKTVHIINHSAYPSSDGSLHDLVANRLYQKVYSLVDYIAIREPESHQVMSQLGVKAAQSFDSLPIYINESYEGIGTPSEDIVYSGSVAYTDNSVEIQAEYIKYLISAGHKVKFLTGASDFPDMREKALIDKLQALVPELGVLNAQSLDEWLEQIQTARLFISGRFHHTIAAICFGTPCIVLNSNTKKVDSILKMLSMPSPLRYNSRDLLNELIYRTNTCLDQLPISNDQIKKMNVKLVEMAKRNFDYL